MGNLSPVILLKFFPGYLFIRKISVGYRDEQGATGWKCSSGKVSSPVTEISVAKTEISVTRLAAFSYEHIKIFTKGRLARRDLGNRGSPVYRAHMKRPLA